MKLSAHVTVPDGYYIFTVLLHVAQNEDELRLDPVEFYKIGPEKRLEFPHVEMEILEPDALFFSQREARAKDKEVVGLHTHRALDGKTYFLCFDSRIADREAALKIFRIWCIGTVYALQYNLEMNTCIETECAGDLERFAALMEKVFHIVFHHDPENLLPAV